MLLRNWRHFFWERCEPTALCTSTRALALPLLIRKTLTIEGSFGSALHALATEPQGGLSYLIIAGIKANEGAVITRARRCAADVSSDTPMVSGDVTLTVSTHRGFVAGRMSLWMVLFCFAGSAQALFSSRAASASSKFPPTMHPPPSPKFRPSSLV